LKRSGKRVYGEARKNPGETPKQKHLPHRTARNN
jgi:hypothetical protein